MKHNLSFRKVKFLTFNFALTTFFTAVEVLAQMPTLRVPTASETEEIPEDYTWWYMLLFLLIAGLVGVVFWRKKIKQETINRSQNSKKAAAQKNNGGSLDAGKELEWYRKNQKSMGVKSNVGRDLPNGRHFPSANLNNSPNGNFGEAEVDAESGKTGAEPPVFSIQKIEPAKPYALLPLSNDEALMSAVEQTQDETEEDEELRELSVRILAAFKTRNSVEALSEVALYDLSSNLRSKAVTILSDFDHESVFETILLACADPTREVKAAAARALFRLNFDRANAWTRIAESDEDGRIRQIARAAIEADLVGRSLDRLVHEDWKIAQEAVAFTNLIIQSGEIETVFDYLVKHKNINVRKAILHIIKITKNQKALEALYSLLEQNNLPLELQEEVDKTIEEIGFVTV